MKKNYISPAIEALEVRSTFAICEGSEPVGGTDTKPVNPVVPGPPSGGSSGAPRRPF